MNHTDDDKKKNEFYSKTGPKTTKPNRKKCCWCRKTALADRSLCLQCCAKRKAQYEAKKNSRVGAPAAAQNDHTVRLSTGTATLRLVCDPSDHQILFDPPTGIVTAIRVVSPVEGCFHLYVFGMQYPVASDTNQSISLVAEGFDANQAVMQLQQQSHVLAGSSASLHGFVLSNVPRCMLVFQRPLNKSSGLTLEFTLLKSGLEGGLEEEEKVICEQSTETKYSVGLGGLVHTLSPTVQCTASCSVVDQTVLTLQAHRGAHKFFLKSRPRNDGENEEVGTCIFVAADACEKTKGQFSAHTTEVTEQWQRETSFDAYALDDWTVVVSACGACGTCHPLNDIAAVSWFGLYAKSGLSLRPLWFTPYSTRVE